MNPQHTTFPVGTSTRLLTTLITLVLVAATQFHFIAIACADQVLYGIQFGSTATPLYSVSKSTGTATEKFDTGIFGFGLTYDSIRKTLYASDVTGHQIVMIDPILGTQSALISSVDTRSLTYDKNLDRLYATFDNELFAIDPANPSLIPLGDVGIGYLNAIGYNAADAKLYAIGGNGISGGGYFVRLNDPSNLKDQTFIAQLNDQNVENVEAIAFDSDVGLFYGSATNSPFRSLITISPLDGTVQTVGSFGIGNDSINGLAFVPVVPEPATMATILVGLLGMYIRRRPIAFSR